MSDAFGDTHANDAYTIGAILQGAREASGESIEDVSRILRINWRYLQALEEGQFDELPGTAYAIGFIRTYAEYLGINSADLIIQYKALSETSRPKTNLEFPEPIPESGLPGGAILFAGILVAILAYGGWYLATEEDSFLARMVSPVPEDMVDATDQNPSDEAVADETVIVEETTPQPIVVEVAEEIAEQLPEEPMDEITSVEEETPDVTADASSEIEAELTTIANEAPVAAEAVEESVQEVEAVVSEPVHEEAVTEAISSDAVETTQLTMPSEEAPVVEQAVDTDTHNVAQEIETVVAETVEEEIQETVAEAPEPLSPDAVPEVQETAAVQEDSDTRALNEEQLLAVQATLSGDAPTSGETTQTEQTVVPEPVTEPEPVVESVEEVVSAADVTVDEPADGQTGNNSEQTSDADTGTSNTTAEDDQVAAIPAEEPVPETITGRVYGDEGDVRIVVRAKTNSWIQVRDDTAGQLLLTRLLRAGDEYHVPDRTGLSLLTGNAGALEILVDGAMVPAIGATGDVRRNVVLDADRLKSGSAAGN